MVLPDEFAFATTMAEATRELAAEPDVDRALQLIIDLAADSVVCEGASITLRLPGGRFRTLAPTDERIRRADHLQYEMNEGPCVSATFADGIFLVDDLATDERWPRWGPAALDLGLHSILSLHLYTTKLSVGALNLYGKQHHQYGETEVEIAKVVAAHASAALARLRVEQDLWSAVDSRHLIGVAQGILMAQRGITTEQAFGVLQSISKRTNTKLREIAESLITTRTLPDPLLTAGQDVDILGIRATE